MTQHVTSTAMVLFDSPQQRVPHFYSLWDSQSSLWMLLGFYTVFQTAPSAVLKFLQYAAIYINQWYAY